MKFDTIIIGGGLSGLTCGLKLQEKGQNCAIISAGQNAMNFFSGGFGLLSRLPGGTEVTTPLSDMAKLPQEHPYTKIGAENFAKYAAESKELLVKTGIKVNGNADRNRYFVSASGTLKPAWLTIDEIASTESIDGKLGDNILIVNIEGFLDFSTAFIAEALEKRGSKCRIAEIATEELGRLRKSPTEMRSVNIARVLENKSNRDNFISKVKALTGDADCIILPAVFGLKDGSIIDEVRKDLSVNTVFLGTMPPSVPGMRIQTALKQAFEAAGGTFLMGDEVTKAEIDGTKVLSVSSENLGDITLEADNYILASGSYFGHGLIADIEKVTEPVFDADVEFDEDRNNWYDKDFFAKQGYMGFGVKTTSGFRVVRHGQAVDNLYAIGAEVGGHNSLYEGSGAGVAMLTALHVADLISVK